MFYLASRMADRPAWTALATLGMLGSLVYIYKQRLAILTSSSSSGWTSSPAAAAGASIFVLIGVVVGAAIGITALANLDTITESSAPPQRPAASTALVTDYLVNEPLRWSRGLRTPRFSGTTLAQLFGSASFYMADLGWLGDAVRVRAGPARF